VFIEKIYSAGQNVLLLNMMNVYQRIVLPSVNHNSIKAPMDGYPKTNGVDPGQMAPLRAI